MSWTPVANESSLSYEGETGKAKVYQIRQLILAIDKLAEIKVAPVKAGKGDKDA